MHGGQPAIPHLTRRRSRPPRTKSDAEARWVFLMPQNVRNDSSFSKRAEENRGHRDVHHDFLEHRHCLRHTDDTAQRARAWRGWAEAGAGARHTCLSAVLGPGKRASVCLFQRQQRRQGAPAAPCPFSSSSSSSRVSLPPPFRPLFPPLCFSQRPSVCPPPLEDKNEWNYCPLCHNIFYKGILCKYWVFLNTIFYNQSTI